jgi:hypothetical protein
MEKQQYSLPPIADFLSLPWQKLMDHALKNRLMDSPWLLLHSLLCRIITYTLAKQLPSEKVDVDTLLSLGLVSHSTRLIAEEGIQWIHPDPAMNEYMQNHSNIDFAYQDAISEWFSSEIIEWIQHFTGNPRTRMGYFPHETMMNGGAINWTEALYQIASWSIAWWITTLDMRFDDLRARRSIDIWKLELDYIKEQIRMEGAYIVPEPIVRAAWISLGQDITSDTLKDMIQEEWSIIDDKKLWEWMLNSYEEWADMVRKKYCEMVWVDDFDVFLREQMDAVSDPEMKLKIHSSFESAIWRKLRDDEFFPAMPGIDLIYKRIWAMKMEWTKERARKNVERLMMNIDRVTRPFMNSQKN